MYYYNLVSRIDNRRALFTLYIDKLFNSIEINSLNRRTKEYIEGWMGRWID